MIFCCEILVRATLVSAEIQGSRAACEHLQPHHARGRRRRHAVLGLSACNVLNIALDGVLRAALVSAGLQGSRPAREYLQAPHVRGRPRRHAGPA